MRAGTDGRLAVSAAGATMLTALALTPLAKSAAWLLGALLVVLTVMVAGIVLRQTANRWGLPVLGQLVALFAVLALLFTRGELLSPAGSVRGMLDLGAAGLDISREQAAPVDATTGIVFLLVSGAGLIALLVDLLAATLRQTALAGLPLLALYCVPAALLPDGLPWYLFGLAAAGFLLLLSADADERTLSWGRVLGGERGTNTSDWMPRGGRRAAAIALGVALVVPTVTPGLGGQLLGSGGIGAGDGGNGKITRINPILSLREDLNQGQNNTLLSYRSTVTNPEPLRIVTADEFNGNVWAPSTPELSTGDRVQSGLPTPPGLSAAVARTSATTRISVGDLRETYLPLPYPTTRVEIEGNWLYDPATLNVIGNRNDTRGATYTVSHLQVRPTAAQLAESRAGTAQDVSAVNLAVPDRLPTSIRSTANRIAGNGTAYDQAVKLQRWFRTQFTYDTKAPQVAAGSDSGSAAIAKFLQTRRGYCVHFASSMALMARTLGIPARVAIGFLPGERNAAGDMVVRAHDAHAWPELYFANIGWVRFEPTPRGAGTEPPAWTQPNSANLPDDTASSSSQAAAPSSDAASPSAGAVPGQDATQGGQGDQNQGTRVPWPLIVVVLAMLLLLALPWFAAGVSRRFRWRRARGPDAARRLAEAAWEDLRLGLGDLGMHWVHSWTPRALQGWMLGEYDLPEEPADALRRLVEDIELARYAPPGAGLDRSRQERREDVRLVVDAVARTRKRPEQVRAKAFPASGVAAVRGWLEAVSGGLRALTERFTRRSDDRSDDSQFTAESEQLTPQELTEATPPKQPSATSPRPRAPFS